MISITFLIYRYAKAVFLLHLLATLDLSETLLYQQMVHQMLILAIASGIFGAYFVNKSILSRKYLEITFIIYFLLSSFLLIVFHAADLGYSILGLGLVGSLDVLVINGRFVVISKRWLFIILLFMFLVGSYFYNISLPLYIACETALRAFLVVFLLLPRRVSWRDIKSCIFVYFRIFTRLLKQDGVAYFINSIFGMAKFRFIEAVSQKYFGINANVLVKILEIIYSTCGVLSIRVITSAKLNRIFAKSAKILILAPSVILPISLSQYVTYDIEDIGSIILIAITITAPSALPIYLVTNTIYKVQSINRLFKCSLPIHVAETLMAFVLIATLLLPADSLKLISLCGFVVLIFVLYLYICSLSKFWNFVYRRP